MTAIAVELKKYMTHLSRRHFKTSWENGLEYILWRWLHSASPLSQEEVFTLYSHHNRARGWWILVDDEPVFVHTDKWIWMFADEFEGIKID